MSFIDHDSWAELRETRANAERWHLEAANLQKELELTRRQLDEMRSLSQGLDRSLSSQLEVLVFYIQSRK